MPGISGNPITSFFLGDQRMVASTADEQDRENLCHLRGLHGNSEKIIHEKYARKFDDTSK